jgi:hypothetical protein
MKEVILNCDFATGARNNWDVLSDMQITISDSTSAELGCACAGRNTAGRSLQIVRGSRLMQRLRQANQVLWGHANYSRSRAIGYQEKATETRKGKTVKRKRSRRRDP